MSRRCGSCGSDVADTAKFCRSCGSPITTGLLNRIRRKAGKAKLAIGIGVLALVLGVGGVLWFGQTVVHPPDQPVRRWFEVLAARDTAAARELAGSSSVLVGDALKTGYEPPTDLEIAGVEYGSAVDETRRPNKNVAYVRVRYRVGTQLIAGSIEVWRDRTGPIRPWSLGDGATGPLHVVNALVSKARVAGANVATVKAKPGNSLDGAVWAPPGVFTITSTNDHPLFVGKPASVAIAAGVVDAAKSTVVELDLAAKTEAVTAIEKQIRERLDECAKSDELALYDCPFGYSKLDTLGATNVRWKVLAYPRITLAPSANQHLSGGIADVQTIEAGKAIATFQAGGRADSRTVDISVGGGVKVMPDKSLCWNEDSSALAC